MIIANTITDVRIQIKAWIREGKSIGFVPTMGYLHEGHQSLIERARNENDKVVVSVFVNPTQFGPNEDLESYPRDFNKDKSICQMSGTDMIFHPAVEEMYETDACTWMHVEGLTNTLCGKSRPTHFDGVCLVVSKLFHIVTPNKAYFGEKDAQQLAVIKRMVTDLSFDIEIVGCPIVREVDGLAKSSRNAYLNEHERIAAVVINKALIKGKEMILTGETNARIVKNEIIEWIDKEPLAKLDYADVVDFDQIEPINTIKGNVLVAVAVFIGKTRLIDNFIIKA